MNEKSINWSYDDLKNHIKFKKEYRIKKDNRILLGNDVLTLKENGIYRSQHVSTTSLTPMEEICGA